ncbi:unnamed protein product [Caenorhabditis brenneri]
MVLYLSRQWSYAQNLAHWEKKLVEHESRVFSYLFGFVHDPRQELTEVFENDGFR